MKTSDLNYTEAFAGSGEFAISRLVVEISRAPGASLILLDEPEVSLHPGAQDRLVEFLLEECKSKKHQIVISTHSPAIIRKLPDDAIKAFVYDPSISKIRLPTQSAAPEEAFFYLGEPVAEKVTIIVEDPLAVHFVKKSLRIKGEAFLNRFEIEFFPGGAETLWTQYIPIFVEDGRTDIVVFLDGDKRPATPLPSPDTLPPEDEVAELKRLLREAAGSDIHFLTDGGGSGSTAAQRQRSEALQNAARRRFVAWAANHVKYLPGNSNPEAFIWENMPVNAASEEIGIRLDPKDRFVELTKVEMGLGSYETVNSADILQTEVRRLATISSLLPEFNELLEQIVGFAESMKSNL